MYGRDDQHATSVGGRQARRAYLVIDGQSSYGK
jgi:hypothetical protein